MFALLAVCLAEAPHMPDLPKLPSMDTFAVPKSVTEEQAHRDAHSQPWKVDFEGKVTLSDRLSNANININNDVSTAKVEAVNNKFAAIKDEVAAIATKVEREAEQNEAIRNANAEEGDSLITLSNNEQKFTNEFNLAAQASNQMYTAYQQWTDTLDNAARIESFVAQNEDGAVNVLGGADQTMKLMTAELGHLEETLKGEVEIAQGQTVDMFDWSRNASKGLNNLAITLKDFVARCTQSDAVFKKAQQKILQLIDALQTEQVGLPGALVEESSTSTVMDRKQKMLANLAKNPLTPEHRASLTALLHGMSGKVEAFGSTIGHAATNGMKVKSQWRNPAEVLQDVEKEVVKRFKDA